MRASASSASPSKRQRLSPTRAAAEPAEKPPAERPPAFAAQPNGRHLQVGVRSRGQLLTGVPPPAQQAAPKRTAPTKKPAPPPLSSMLASAAAANGAASAAGPSNAVRPSNALRAESAAPGRAGHGGAPSAMAEGGQGGRTSSMRAPAGLPLPAAYRKLHESFLALETTIGFFRARGEPCSNPN